AGRIGCVKAIAGQSLSRVHDRSCRRADEVSATAEGGEELRERQGVQHVVRLEPGAASLIDAVPHQVEVGNAMGVGRDDDAAAELAGEDQVGVSQVQAV